MTAQLSSETNRRFPPMSVCEKAPRDRHCDNCHDDDNNNNNGTESSARRGAAPRTGAVTRTLGLHRAQKPRELRRVRDVAHALPRRVQQRAQLGHAPVSPPRLPPSRCPPDNELNGGRL